MALTPKHRRFVDAVLAGASHKQAAIEAGYSAKTAAAAGSRLAKHPAIVEALGRGLEKKAKDAGKLLAAEPPAHAEPAPPDVEGRSVPDLLKMYREPKDFLMALMNDAEQDIKARLEAGKALLPFFHAKKGDAGKKESQQQAAAAAGGGKFGPKGPPRLVVNNDK